MSKIGTVQPKAPLKLTELLGEELATNLGTLENATLEKKVLDLEFAWRRWLAHEHGARAPAAGTPSKEILERGIPVLRALLAARLTAAKAEDAVAKQGAAHAAMNASKP